LARASLILEPIRVEDLAGKAGGLEARDKSQKDEGHGFEPLAAPFLMCLFDEKVTFRHHRIMA